MTRAPEQSFDLSELWDQDVEIDVRVCSLVRAIDADDLATARRGAEDLEAYVLAHLKREEDVYFPAAERLDPRLAGELTTIRLAHRGIRDDLRELRTLLEAGHLQAARAVSDAFLESFRSHEQAEDRLVEALGTRRGA